MKIYAHTHTHTFTLTPTHLPSPLLSRLFEDGLSKRDGIAFLPHKRLIFSSNHIQLPSAFLLVYTSRLAVEIRVIPRWSGAVRHHFILAIYGRYGISRNGTHVSVMLKELKDSAQPKPF